MERYEVGYTQGVFDMFHIGHLNLINQAKLNCEKLIVGVNSDSLVEAYKNKTPVIDAKSRAEIVRNIKAVDECVIVDTLDKEKIYLQLPFDVIFIGDDWKNSDRWNETERIMKKYGVDVVYLKHTPNISSTNLRGQVESDLTE